MNGPKLDLLHTNLADASTRDSLRAAYAANHDKDARIAELTAALEWALAEIDGKTNYYNPFQRGECLKRARAAIASVEGK